MYTTEQIDFLIQAAYGAQILGVAAFLLLAQIALIQRAWLAERCAARKGTWTR